MTRPQKIALLVAFVTLVLILVVTVFRDGTSW
jgi:hypothetical protein